MEMLCPECLGPLEARDGRMARCTLHGGHYRVLFWRGQPWTTMAHEPGQSITGLANRIVSKCTHCGQRFKILAEHVGKKARCKICQSEFVVAPFPSHLVSGGDSSQAIVASAPLTAQATKGRTCVRHANKPAEYVCARCGSPICATCSFPQASGSQLCPDCVNVVATALAPGERASEDFTGVVCAHHPNVQAVRRCAVCGAPMCATCDFELPGRVHVCPTCVAAPRQGLSGKRKGYLVWSYVLAAWCTLGLAVIFSGALAGTVESQAGVEVLGVIIFLLIFAPSIIGTALGFAALERRLANPASVWVAAIWNGIILAVLLLLVIIGSFS